MIEFRTLGTLDLRARDGRELRSILVQSKRVALLVYLALARPRGFQRRDTLLALLWPEVDAEHARSSLRTAIHRLRAALGDAALPGRGSEEVQLDASVVWCDAVPFEEALDAGPDEEALGLYRGDLMAGFYVRDAAPEFEQWLEGERSRLRERAKQAAWRLAEQRLQERRTEEAIGYGYRAAELAPEDEPGLRRLIELLDRCGDRAGALRAYDEFARRMAAEYAAEPAAETRARIEAVRGAPGRRRRGASPVSKRQGCPAERWRVSGARGATGSGRRRSRRYCWAASGWCGGAHGRARA